LLFVKICPFSHVKIKANVKKTSCCILTVFDKVKDDDYKEEEKEIKLEKER